MRENLAYFASIVDAPASRIEEVIGTVGLLASAFARTEFQVIQFMPAFILPQLLLCGVFAPRDTMAGVLEAISYALPMSYAFEALQKITVEGTLGSAGVVDVVVTVGVTVLALVLAAGTLRRRTA